MHPSVIVAVPRPAGHGSAATLHLAQLDFLLEASTVTLLGSADLRERGQAAYRLLSKGVAR